jgi:hypothetical protein
VRSGCVGSWLKFEFKERVIVSGLEIINGWIPQNYPDFFQYNHRAKQITIIFDDGSQELFTLEDNNGDQKILFKERKLTKFVKVQIDKIYQATKSGEPWVTISEISFY